MLVGTTIDLLGAKVELLGAAVDYFDSTVDYFDGTAVDCCSRIKTKTVFVKTLRSEEDCLTFVL